MDLHSGRSQVDFEWLANLAGRDEIKSANTAMQALEIAGPGIAQTIADRARESVLAILRGAPVVADVVIVSRSGDVVAASGPAVN